MNPNLVESIYWRSSIEIAHFFHLSFCFEETLYWTFHRCFLPNFCSFDYSVSEEIFFKKSTNQKQELPVVSMFVNGSGTGHIWVYALLSAYNSMGTYSILVCLSRFTLWMQIIGPIAFILFGRMIGNLNVKFLQTRGSVGWACVAHFSFCFEETLYRTFHRCFLWNFSSFGNSVTEEKIFKKSTNQKQELPVVSMFVNGSIAFILFGRMIGRDV
jgi:hypothetical protein